MNFSLFVSCPKGLEYLLEEEVKALGLQVTQVNPQGVYGEASLAVVYQLCIWSRLANRVQLILFSGHAFNEQTLYKLCHQFAWQTVFSADKTLAVEFHGSSAHIRNTMYGAQVVKDAIADHFRKLQNIRPTVAKDKPQILVHAYLKQETLTVSFDLTGYSLHQRGYRTEAGIAPIKENVAAALLLRAQWPKRLQQGFALDDPFCGSGTLVIEAAMMAAQVAPGLLRQDQSLCHWAMHQSTLWDKMRTQALKQVRPVHVKLTGTDYHEQVILAAKANAERAGVGRIVEFSVCKLGDCRPKASQGLVIANPPYGERLSDATQLMPLYQQLGQVMHEHYQGWEMAVLTSNPMLAKAIGLRAHKHYTVYNGALECKLYCFKLQDNRLKTGGSGQWQGPANMFANRLQKNIRHLHKWAKRHDIQCYRVYDHDLPEYAYAIDLYNDYAVLQESAPPQSVPKHKAEQRSLEVLQIVPQVLNVMPANLVVKQRKQQKGSSQYQKMGQSHQSIVVKEGQAKFYVNLYDYLDTGLFLDHRLLRLQFAKLSQGTRFLNCFCYTAAASVHAALAGALTTNVDLSKTYMNWARRNFQLNELDLQKHQFIQEDCIAWLKTCRERFDVIFLDPPSFSNSKRMQGTLDIQRDHEVLITSAARLLEEDGILYFSTNLRKFKLSPYISSHFEVEDMSAETIDVDFKRNAKIHQCFTIRKKRISA